MESTESCWLKPTFLSLPSSNTTAMRRSALLIFHSTLLWSTDSPPVDRALAPAPKEIHSMALNCVIKLSNFWMLFLHGSVNNRPIGFWAITTRVEWQIATVGHWLMACLWCSSCCPEHQWLITEKKLEWKTLSSHGKIPKIRKDVVLDPIVLMRRRATLAEHQCNGTLHSTPDSLHLKPLGFQWAAIQQLLTSKLKRKI